MEAEAAMDLCRETMIQALVLGAPILVVGMVVGLVVGMGQALTQIQDQTVAFVPKLLAMAAILIVCLPWLMERLMEFTRQVMVAPWNLS
jgi:flagellar biosynthesis protein FliQ